jgi:hypothetical protein
MSASLPADACPECGAGRIPGQVQCWLCHGDLSPTASVARAALPAESPAGCQYSLASLLLLMTLAAILLSITSMNPGLGIFLAVLMVPACLRTAIVATLRRSRGKPMSLLAKVGTFSMTLGMAIIVMVVAGATFVVTFLAMCSATRSGSGWRGGPGQDIVFWIPVLAALGVSALLILFFWWILRLGRNR